MSESNEELPQIGRYKVLHSELPENLTNRLMQLASDCIGNDNKLDKDSCNMLAAKLNSAKEFEDQGQGEWQCFIGKFLAASLSYDTGVLAFFELIDKGKTVLAFRS